MRKGFIFLIVLMVFALFALMLAPVIMQVMQGGHP